MSGVISGVIAGMGGVVAPTITGTSGYWDFTYTSSLGSTSDGRTKFGDKYFYMPDNVTNGGAAAIGYTVTGGGLTYEWQYLSYYGFHFSACSVRAYDAFSMAGDAGYPYNDAISGGNTATLTFSSVYGYYSRNNTSPAYRGVDGYWRLKASNAAGTIYSHWTLVHKVWNSYTYDCNCWCPCSTSSCNCQGCCSTCYDAEGYPYDCDCTCQCSQCCDCTENCDTCTGYYDESYGYYNAWCA